MAKEDPRLQMLMDAAVPFRVPLRCGFRRVEAREGLLLKGPSGWGEFAPFLEYESRVAARWLSAAVEAAWGEWPAPRRDRIPVNAIVPAVTSGAAGDLAAETIEHDGCTTIKVKVAEPGDCLADDLERVSAVRQALDLAGFPAPVGRIRVDANAAWGVEEAATSIPRLDDAAHGLEYVEQPCATLAELAALKAVIAVPVAADESIRTARDPGAAVAAGRIDIAVVKVAPLGGVAAALRTAEACGVPVVVSGAIDTAVGLGPGLALASALPELQFACGLGTGSLLVDDVTATPLRPLQGTLPVTRAVPDPQALAIAGGLMPGPRRDWWLSRLAGAWVAGANQYAGRWLEA